MSDLSSIRVLLALSLALWSPGWCLCSLLGCSSTKVAVAGFEGDELAPPVESCCRGSDEADPRGPQRHQGATGDSCCGPLPGSDDPGRDSSCCGCGSPGRQFAIDSPATLPAKEWSGPGIDLLTFLPPLVAPSASERSRFSPGCRGAPSQRAAGSLFAQHCLLTI